MNRRTFLTGSGIATAAGNRRRHRAADDYPGSRGVSASSSGGPGLEPYGGPWGFEQAAHLLRRTLFGVRKEEIDAIAAMSVGEAVDTLLEPKPAPPVPVAYQNQTEVQWVAASYNANNDNLYQTYLLSWWIDLMLNQGLSLREKMVLFWHNHFATGAVSVKDARYMYAQNAMLREHAFGNFKELVRLITFDPAMLRYLNGSANRKGSPNENYARELQELFTIGKGPERAPGDYTNYTEADIKAAARVLTGWSDDAAKIISKFTASQHDTGEKTFSAAYGNRTIKGGSTETAARGEIDQLIDMIFEQEATSKYICRKLYRWFVDYAIDAEIESGVIEPMAALLRASGFEVKPVLAALFKSAHFYQGGRIGCVIKSPADLVLGSVRTFRWLDDDTHETLFPTDTRKKNWAYRTLRRGMGTQGLDLMNPPNVAGWPAYWQSPLYHEVWINADTLQKRINFLNDSSADGLLLDEAYYKSYIDVIDFVERLSDPANPAALIRESAAILLPIPLTDAQKELLNDILLPGLPDYEWGAEWSDYKADAANATKRKAVEDKLRALFKYILAMAEYQLS